VSSQVQYQCVTTSNVENELLSTAVSVVLKIGCERAQQFDIYIYIVMLFC